MTETRLDRLLESRSEEDRESQSRVEHWVPPAMLATPEPPEGFVFRWIRSEVVGKDDTRNVASAMREGFEPVRINELRPDDQAMYGLDTVHGGIVRVNEMILCKQPKHLADQRKRYYEDRAARMQKAIDSQLKGEGRITPNMDVHIERRTTVSRGKPQFQEDE